MTNQCGPASIDESQLVIAKYVFVICENCMSLHMNGRHG